jgi:hypothetical protein
VDALLIEDPPDDQNAGPRPGSRDDPPIAAGYVKSATFGALEQQGEDPNRDEQNRCLDEREGLPTGQ